MTNRKALSTFIHIPFNHLLLYFASAGGTAAQGLLPDKEKGA
ncbi:hypothetical protein HMPREF3201_01168 [Megasphaera sp. MJR8396C]|nr:hypothetical protein HMPREF3201_01168 [Megasphaera sp. MJR8396C]